jgi:quercetin dioxygenase-like cupin family protein
MTAWTRDELDRMGAAEELQLTARRRNGTLREPVTIWVVRNGDDLYVRSWRGKDGGWFRAIQQSREGHISAGGVDKDVSFVDASGDGNDAIDAAYLEKYHSYADSYIEPMVRPAARATTMQLVPRTSTDTYVISAKEHDMQIIRNTLETGRGPSDWFTGSVFIDTIATPSEASQIGAACVHFTPGARTAWHTHPTGQTIWVTEGVGLCQRRGGPTEIIRPGDRVFFEPGEDHWHGAAPIRFMTHVAMQQADDHGTVVTWGDHVTDEEYAAAPPIDA